MNEFDYELKPTTRVISYLKDQQVYLVTNQEGTPDARTRVFAIRKDGTIPMRGAYLLGSIFAHCPYIVLEWEDLNCTYGELNPEYFQN